MMKGSRGGRGGRGGRRGATGIGLARLRSMSSFTFMPELSRFYGIVIRMFSEPSAVHHTPHFHDYYQEHTAVYRIGPVALLSGSLPTKQSRLVEAWAELHQDELADDWSQLLEGRPPKAIRPLS